MRPYSGIGVLQLPSAAPLEAVPMYDDPGIKRCCTLDFDGAMSLNAWLFGQSAARYLIVTSRKGEWLEVEHDDAGRTGWLTPQRSWKFATWEQFLKGRMAVFLRNSPPKMVQLFSGQSVEHGRPIATKQPLKIIKTQGDWAHVLLDQSSAGWIRWRDNDGRLLIGFDTSARK